MIRFLHILYGHSCSITCVIRSLEEGSYNALDQLYRLSRFEFNNVIKNGFNNVVNYEVFLFSSAGTSQVIVSLFFLKEIIC